MKKILLALAVCAALPAYAETNVTLYGGVDGGVTVQKLKGKSATVQFSNGNWDTNMFGFTGTEDLGNGNSVFFRLEQGYDLSTGEGEGAFNRQSYLGLGGSWGQVAFGRIGALGSDNGEYSIHGSSAYTTSFSPLSNIYSAFIVTDWMDNTIAYQTPSFGNWTFHAMYSNGIGDDTAKWAKNDHYYGLGATYEADAFTFGAYWEMLDNKGLPNEERQDAKDPKATNLFTVQASYDFGSFALIGAYQYALHSMQLPNYTDIENVHKGANQHALALSLTAPFAGGTAMLQTQGAIGKLKDTNEKYNSYSIGAAYLYPLSKRTTLYGQAGWGQLGKAFKQYSEASELGGWSVTFGMGHNF